MLYDGVYDMGLIKGKEAAYNLARLDIASGLSCRTEREFYETKAKINADISPDDCHNGFEVAYRLGYNQGFTYENYESIFRTRF